MKQYVCALLDQLALSDEGYTVLRDAAERLFAHDPTVLEAAVDTYYTNDFANQPVYDILMPIADALHITKEAVNLLVVAAAAQRMQNTYRERGYDEALFTDFLKDLRCKIGECYRWYGIWGLTKITYWYPLFFKMKIFALGRLQYELYQRPNQTDAVTVGGYTIAPDEPVFYIHIPGIGPLTEELRFDSYRRAYEFFKNDHDGRPFVCYCGSWLLYERNREFLKPTSNIVGFMNDFKIVKSFEVPEQKYWWVFDMPYEGDASVLPRDTSVRRGLADWLAAGGIPGGGDGYFLFDGERIIND